MAGTGAVDGGWWPRSRDPDAELPELIAGLASSLGPITRVALNLDAWDTAPRRVAVDGRRIRVGWFRQMDADTIGVTRAGQNRVALLVDPAAGNHGRGGDRDGDGGRRGQQRRPGRHPRSRRNRRGPGPHIPAATPVATHQSQAR